MDGNINVQEYTRDYMMQYIDDCLDVFFKLMNEKAQQLELKKTNFAVAHGMHHDDNYSTAQDIARLSCEALKKPKFR